MYLNSVSMKSGVAQSAPFSFPYLGAFFKIIKLKDFFLDRVK